MGDLLLDARRPTSRYDDGGLPLATLLAHVLLVARRPTSRYGDDRLLLEKTRGAYFSRRGDILPDTTIEE